MTVVMYVKPGCPYCQAAREHFDQAGAEVEERDATVNSTWKSELMSYTNGGGVVPTIVRADEGVQVGFPPGLTRPLSGRSVAARIAVLERQQQRCHLRLAHSLAHGVPLPPLPPGVYAGDAAVLNHALETEAITGGLGERRTKAEGSRESW